MPPGVWGQLWADAHGEDLGIVAGRLGTTGGVNERHGGLPRGPASGIRLAVGKKIRQQRQHRCR